MLTLPPLPYAEDALAPYISADTLATHHGKHHKAYVDKTNALIEGTPLGDQPLETIIRAAKRDGNTKLFNQAAQAWNHAFLWQSMRPNGGGKPSGALAAALERSFGSMFDFREQWTKASTEAFGSGWTWLTADGGRLKIVTSHDADTPIAQGRTPLLTLDLWEHAYYLDWKNERPKYVAAFLDALVNWDFAAANFAPVAEQRQAA